MKLGVIAQRFAKPLDEALKLAASTGVDGVQLYAVSPRENLLESSAAARKELRARCGDLGLEIFSICGEVGGFGFREADVNPRNVEKIRRSIGKVLPGAPHEVWLTVDSSLGANVVNQAREFIKSAGVTGLVLTKLDGTGRGGMAVALHEEFDLPTFYVGLGEQPGELQYFDPEFYADALFDVKE